MVQNTGGSPYVLGAIGVSGGEFTRVGGSCAAGTRLAPTQSCTVDIAFAPAATGDRTGSLAVTSAAGFDANAAC